MIDTGEMYLKTVYELEEEGIPPLRARIAERLDHSGPTVSETVNRLARDGLLVIGPNRRIELTVAGRRKATEVMRKHRIAERLLIDVIGMDWEYAHEEACRWEHVMSDRVAEKLDVILGHISHDPYGNPIPSAAEGPGDLAAEESGLIALADVDSDRFTATLRRIAEPLQVDVELLSRLKAAGVVPGVEISVEKMPQGLAITGSKGMLEQLGDAVGKHLFIDR
nr:metal-dependent transcriptional regulator [Flaviflexus huanghaiensis]